MIWLVIQGDILLHVIYFLSGLLQDANHIIDVVTVTIAETSASIGQPELSF